MPLVLSRRQRQAIVIGNNVIVSIGEIRGDVVKLVITAPKEVPVHRQEVFDEIQRQKEGDDA